MRKNSILFSIIFFNIFLTSCKSDKSTSPMVNKKLVFNEVNGLVAIEAEFFYKQTRTDIRQWYIIHKNSFPNIKGDSNEIHIDGASNNAYIKILPDTRVTHDDELISGENFSNVPGKLAIVHYKVHINNPGRYYVWVRAYSTGTEDNGVHVGIDDTWPEHGQRMQWCEGKNTWTWESKQRTNEVHCGVPHEIYLDIEEAGIHDIQFSMREDGFELDKFILTTDINYKPEGKGPGMNIKSGNLPQMPE